MKNKKIRKTTVAWKCLIRWRNFLFIKNSEVNYLPKKTAVDYM